MLVMGLALAMVPVVMFPVFKKYNEVLALGCVVFRGALESVGYMASAAMWLPIVPFIAAEMQRPGSPPVRWWGPVLYGCVVCYGLYFYWLAFVG